MAGDDGVQATSADEFTTALAAALQNRAPAFGVDASSYGSPYWSVRVF